MKSGSQEAYLFELAMSDPAEQCGERDAMGLYSKVLGPFYHPELTSCVGAIVYVIGELEADSYFIDTYQSETDLNTAWQTCVGSI
jgi:hypothetical protein